MRVKRTSVGRRIRRVETSCPLRRAAETTDVSGVASGSYLRGGNFCPVLTMTTRGPCEDGSDMEPAARGGFRVTPKPSPVDTSARLLASPLLSDKRTGRERGPSRASPSVQGTKRPRALLRVAQRRNVETPPLSPPAFAILVRVTHRMDPPRPPRPAPLRIHPRCMRGTHARVTRVCVCVCAHARVRACVRACVRAVTRMCTHKHT